VLKMVGGRGGHGGRDAEPIDRLDRHQGAHMREPEPHGVDLSPSHGTDGRAASSPDWPTQADPDEGQATLTCVPRYCQEEAQIVPIGHPVHRSSVRYRTGALCSFAIPRPAYKA